MYEPHSTATHSRYKLPSSHEDGDVDDADDAEEDVNDAEEDVDSTLPGSSVDVFFETCSVLARERMRRHRESVSS